MVAEKYYRYGFARPIFMNRYTLKLKRTHLRNSILKRALSDVGMNIGLVLVLLIMA